VRLLGFRLKSLFKELAILFGFLACSILGRCLWLSTHVGDLTYEYSLRTPTWYDFISTWRLGLACFCIFAVCFVLAGWGGRLKRFVPLLKKLALGCGVLLAVLALFVLEENIRGKIALRSCIRQLRAQGEKLKLADFDLPKSSKEGNGADALITLTNQFNAMRKDCPFFLESIVTRIQLVAPGRAIVRSDQMDLGVNRTPVSYDPPAPSGTAGGRRGRTAYEGETNTTFLAPVKASWADLDGQVLRASNLLEEVRTVLSCPSLIIQIDYAQGLEGIRLPHLPVIRAAANWFALTALSEIHSRNLDGVTSNIMSIATLTHFGQDELLLISQTYRWQIGLTGLGVTWEALQRTGWTDEQLLALQQAWSQSSVIQNTPSILEMERLLYRNQFVRARHLPTWGEFGNGLFYDSQGGSPPYDLDEVLSHIRDSANGIAWRLAWFEQDESRFLQRYELVLDRARNAVARQNWSAFGLSEKDLPPSRSLYDRWRFLLSNVFTPSVELPLLHMFEYETQREMTVAAIAIKRYQLRTGALPSDLAALVPGYLPLLPHDWMDGKPLRYHPNTDGTFALYSVGVDGRDDGGDPTPTKGKRANSIWDGRDALWPMPASAEEIAASLHPSTQ